MRFISRIGSPLVAENHSRIRSLARFFSHRVAEAPPPSPTDNPVDVLQESRKLIDPDKLGHLEHILQCQTHLF